MERGEPEREDGPRWAVESFGPASLIMKVLFVISRLPSAKTAKLCDHSPNVGLGLLRVSESVSTRRQ